MSQAKNICAERDFGGSGVELPGGYCVVLLKLLEDSASSEEHNTHYPLTNQFYIDLSSDHAITSCSKLNPYCEYRVTHFMT